MMLAAENLTLARGGNRIPGPGVAGAAAGEIWYEPAGRQWRGQSPRCWSALSAELAPDAGRLRLDDGDLARLPHREQARRRAVLPQKPGLTFDLDVREVVAMGAYPFPELSPAAVDAGGRGWAGPT